MNQREIAKLKIGDRVMYQTKTNQPIAYAGYVIDKGIETINYWKTPYVRIKIEYTHDRRNIGDAITNRGHNLKKCSDELYLKLIYDSKIKVFVF